VIVGVDVGTQSLKVAVLDAALRIKGRAARGYELLRPQSGWIEQDPAAWEQALEPAIAEALMAADARPRQVTAIGICGQLDGCIPTDDDGVALSNCLTWMDRRASAEIADIPAATIRAACGVVLDPSHLAAKARWLKRHLPAARSIARFHQPVSYLVERLTGAAKIDHALASTSMVYCLDRRAYDPSLMEIFELAEAELPPIMPAESCAGHLTERGRRLTGLPVGIPVAVGTGDDFSMPLGAGLMAPGRISISVGTGEVIGALHASALRDAGGLLETHAYPGGQYYIENPGWLSGGAMVWLRDLLGMADFAAMDKLADTVPPGAGGLCFLPALTGAMAPEWHPGARGCFYGLTPLHGRAHLIRAVMEGCAFAMRDVIDRMAEIGMATDSILLLGGGAKSRLWAQMRADIARRPVAVPDCIDTSPVAAALLAAIAAGHVADIPAAMRSIGSIRETYAPDTGRAVEYECAYAVYRRLFQSLKPFFADTHADNSQPALH
jgi:xylulokinase